MVPEAGRNLGEGRGEEALGKLIMCVGVCRLEALQCLSAGVNPRAGD